MNFISSLVTSLYGLMYKMPLQIGSEIEKPILLTGMWQKIGGNFMVYLMVFWKLQSLSYVFEMFEWNIAKWLLVGQIVAIIFLLGLGTVWIVKKHTGLIADVLVLNCFTAVYGPLIIAMAEVNIMQLTAIIETSIRLIIPITLFCICLASPDSIDKSYFNPSLYNKTDGPFSDYFEDSFFGAMFSETLVNLGFSLIVTVIVIFFTEGIRKGLILQNLMLKAVKERDTKFVTETITTWKFRVS